MSDKIQMGIYIAAWLLFCAEIFITVIMLLIIKDKKDNNIY